MKILGLFFSEWYLFLKMRVFSADFAWIEFEWNFYTEKIFISTIVYENRSEN